MATDPASPLAFVPTPPGLAAPRDFVLPVQLDECTPLAILEALGTTATAAASEVDCKRREDALSMQDQANGTSLSTYAGHSSSDGIESLHDLQTDLQTGPSERHDAARHEPASASSQATRAQPFPSSLIANPCAVKTENFERVEAAPRQPLVFGLQGTPIATGQSGTGSSHSHAPDKARAPLRLSLPPKPSYKAPSSLGASYSWHAPSRKPATSGRYGPSEPAQSRLSNAGSSTPPWRRDWDRLWAEPPHRYAASTADSSLRRPDPIQSAQASIAGSSRSIKPVEAFIKPVNLPEASPTATRADGSFRTDASTSARTLDDVESPSDSYSRERMTSSTGDQIELESTSAAASASTSDNSASPSYRKAFSRRDDSFTTEASEPTPATATLRLSSLRYLDKRRIALAKGGDDGPEVPLIFRQSHPRPSFHPLVKHIPEDDPDRAFLIAAAERLAEHAVDSHLQKYVEQGEDLLDAVYDAAKDVKPVVLPHIAFGSATEPVTRWSRDHIAPVPEEATGRAFLSRLSSADIVIVIGYDGLTDNPESLLDDLAHKLPAEADIIVTTVAGKGEPRVMTKEELVFGLQLLVDGEDLEGVAEDVKDWFAGMKTGKARRMKQGAAMREHGGELNRASKRHQKDAKGSRKRQKRDQNGEGTSGGDGGAALQAQDSESTPPTDAEQQPRGWHGFRRCPEPGCFFVGQVSAVKKHIVAARRDGKTAKCRCLGFCPAGCPMPGTSIDEIRRHVSIKHPEMEMCPKSTCICAFAKSISLVDHERQHQSAKVYASGLPHSRLWITEERAMSRPVLEDWELVLQDMNERSSAIANDKEGFADSDNQAFDDDDDEEDDYDDEEDDYDDETDSDEDT